MLGGGLGSHHPIPSVILDSQPTDFLLTVCVTVRSHYSNGLPSNPVLDEALVRVQGQDSTEKMLLLLLPGNCFIYFPF